MSTPFDPNWESRMTRAEAAWCWARLYEVTRRRLPSGDLQYPCVNGYRAAQAWKSTHVRRFGKLRTCCGSHEWIAYRWNWCRFRFDKYMLGFNYGH